MTEVRDEMEGSLRKFVRDIRIAAVLPRVPGTAIFLNRGGTTTPAVDEANVDHNHVLHEHVIIVSMDTVPVPRVPGAARISVVDHLGYRDDGIFFVEASYGCGASRRARGPAVRGPDRHRGRIDPGERLLLPLEGRSGGRAATNHGAVA